jgi:hypothetical protein
MRLIVFICLFFVCFSDAKSQPPTLESSQFYYNSKGVSYIPPMTKPGLVYQGQLYNGRARLDYLIAKLNTPQYTILYDQYRSNRIWGTVLTVLGTATSVVGLIGTGDSRTINWYLLGGGILLNGAALVVNNIAAQQLRAIAVMMDEEQKKKGQIVSPKNIGINIPLK